MFYLVEGEKVVQAAVFKPLGTNLEYIESDLTSTNFDELRFDGEKIVIDEGKVVARENQAKKDARIKELEHYLDELGYDFNQAYAGKQVDNLDFKKEQYRLAYDELCELRGVTPKPDA